MCWPFRVMDVAAPTHTRMVHTHPGQPIAPGIYAWAMRSPPGRLLAATATRSFSLPSLSTPTPPLPAAKHPESFRLFLTLTPTGAKMVTTMTRTKATACPAPPALAPPAPGAAWTPPPATPVCPPASAAWRATSLMTPPASASVPPLELPRLLFWVRGGVPRKRARSCRGLARPAPPRVLARIPHGSTVCIMSTSTLPYNTFAHVFLGLPAAAMCCAGMRPHRGCCPITSSFAVPPEKPSAALCCSCVRFGESEHKFCQRMWLKQAPWCFSMRALLWQRVRALHI